MSQQQQQQATSSSQRPVQVKLVLLGESAVGKSSIVLRFCQNDYQANKEPTIGAAFLTQKCRLEDKIIKFEIWDTAGQERFRSLSPMYYRNAQAAVVVYDVTKHASFEQAKTWVKELQRQASPNIVIGLVGNKLDLVGKDTTSQDAANASSTAATSTEAGEQATEEEEEISQEEQQQTEQASEEASEEQNQDQEDDDDDEDVPRGAKREVGRAEAASYAAEHGALLFFETSAKTGDGVVEVFTEIAKRIPLDALLQQGGGQRGAAQQRAQAHNANGQGRAGRVDLNSNADGGDGNNKGDCSC